MSSYAEAAIQLRCKFDFSEVDQFDQTKQDKNTGEYALMEGCHGKLDELLEKQEAYWYLRSCVSEINDGDKNTKYFHHKASQRKLRNFIHGLYDKRGVWRDDEEDVGWVIENYYNNLFTSSFPSDEALSDVLDVVTPTISAEMNVALCTRVCKDEVWEALRHMHPCKAPGPDGMHVIFYQRFWHIVGDDVTSIVAEAEYIAVADATKEAIWMKKSILELGVVPSVGDDAFLALVRKATVDKAIHGMKASQSGPEISHVLFADDSLLFARACRQKCSKEELIGFLAMRQVDRNSKYLGIPTLAGRSKHHLFSRIMDRVWKKLQGWKEKLLSRAGKEVLLKAVIQAIPTKVFKAKYYPSSSFLDANLGPVGSYSWKSIWGSKSLVIEGVLWRIGNRASIKIWEDPWVISGDSRFITSGRVLVLHYVCDLIDFGSMEWDANMVLENFNEQDGQAIMAVPLSDRLPNDHVAWAFAKDGSYSVKTTYLVGKSENLDLFHRAWVTIWGLQVSPKVRHFLWKICSNSLPVCSILKHRHVIFDDTRLLCLEGPETVSHDLFHCSKAREVWEIAEISHKLPQGGRENWLLLWNEWQEVECENLIALSYVAYYVWLSKGVIFFSDLDVVLEDALFFSKDFVSVKWSRVLRDGNCVAHHLARIIPFGVEQRWESHCPAEVSPYVLMDTMSIE
ncbi:uncharacterized protein LOC130589838 [Beta vulgaris subsp. vulgaris]|uniref:uncharacterized protein LOC130589838 n=1 Tax=Beta vulgaris subsp. vulgaris TaxID=3555 RepID=UPI0025475F22|nr:uncharacterized protein LOC130589838 [Beta vulgaris subsp. vulgaris]